MAASAMASARKPVQSKRTFVSCVADGKVQLMPMVAQMPTGTSM